LCPAYECTCDKQHYWPVEVTAQAMPAATPIIPPYVFVPEQVYQNPHPVIFASSMAHGDLRGHRPPDDGRLDFVLMDDQDGEEDFLPDMFGLFNVVTDLRSGRVEVTQNPTLIASRG
jgi:hypothetical protein